LRLIIKTNTNNVRLATYALSNLLSVFFVLQIHVFFSVLDLGMFTIYLH